MEVGVKKGYEIFGTVYHDLEAVIDRAADIIYSTGWGQEITEYLLALKNMAVDAENELWQKSDEIEALQAELESLESAFDDLNKDYEELLDENTELQRMLADVEKEV